MLRKDAEVSVPGGHFDPVYRFVDELTLRRGDL
jgi:hypothetical protein